MDSYKQKCNEIYDEAYYEIYDPGPETTRNEVEGIIDILRLRPKAEILDMPCGYGRHSKVFADKGYKVTGVDLSGNLLRIAKKKFAHKHITYLHGDMKDIDLKRQYDVCLNLYISFGFYKNSDDNLMVLRNIAKHLKPGGKLLIELVNPFNAVSPGRISGSRYEETKKYLALIKKTVDPMTMWENYSLRVINKKTFKEELKEVGYYLYTIPDLSRMAKETGLELTEFYGGGYHEFSRKAFEFSDGRMIAIFGKK